MEEKRGFGRDVTKIQLQIPKEKPSSDQLNQIGKNRIQEQNRIDKIVAGENVAKIGIKLDTGDDVREALSETARAQTPKELKLAETNLLELKAKLESNIKAEEEATRKKIEILRENIDSRTENFKKTGTG